MALISELPAATDWKGAQTLTDDAGYVYSDGVAWVPLGSGAQGPAGPPASVTNVKVNLPYPAAREHVVTVADAAVTATKKIVATLAGSDSSSDNGATMTDILSLTALAKTGFIDFSFSFLTPTAGPFIIQYSVV